jgi:hypothetical protein
MVDIPAHLVKRTARMPERAPKEPTKRLAVDMPESLHHQLRRLALDERTTASDIIRALVEQRLAQRHQQKHPRKGKAA